MPADNDIAVVGADGLTYPLRAFYLGTDTNSRNVWAQAAQVEQVERPVDPTGGNIVYTVTSASVVPLVPPSAAARFARLRVFDTTFNPATASTQNHRMYYRTDGTNPLNTGANAFGFLMHGEAMRVSLANFANYKMIANAADAGSFTVHVEWLSWYAG